MNTIREFPFACAEISNSSAAMSTSVRTGTSIFFEITSVPNREPPQEGHTARNENGISPGLESPGDVTLSRSSTSSPLSNGIGI